MGFPLDGVATPAMWSRLADPLMRALDLLWDELRLLERARPSGWITLHCGRIAVNAHGWERMRARLNDVPADATLVEPPDRGIASFADRCVEQWERFRVRLGRRSLPERLERAEERTHQVLEAAARHEPRDLDPAALARGPLDEPSWTEILLPWLAARLTGTEAQGLIRPVTHAIGLEQRFSAELGRRLVTRGVLAQPRDVAYLTVEERIRCVNEGSGIWAEHAADRSERVGQFLKFEIPERFWGRPRISS